MEWDAFKELLRREYTPLDQVQKLRTEFWNLKMDGYEVEAHTTRFIELGVLCPHMVDQEFKRVERYIEGLPTQIKSMVTSSGNETITGVIRLAHRLTDQAVSAGSLPERKSTSASGNSSGKCKWEDNSVSQSGSRHSSGNQQRRFDRSATSNRSG
jgi:hypothetical protein